ncbi:MAG: hypothetical protein A2687_01755 [Candidatus Levybacteria bacterium RIFCSPHIGHO2_01_FULL_38_26]|nr:MAG: hypothetical protein A2687_01755 [Candidatus Levybacteria bacterium RIFCSPHIGHO2_01_FULL_38_26]
MKSLAIIGGSGMLGSDLVRYLGKKFDVLSIDRNNYHSHEGKFFDVLINANGNSRRFWANQNPVDDFLASTLSVYKSIFDFSSDFYVYISSPDVYEKHSSPRYTMEERKINSGNLEPYGFNKYLSELIVKKYKKKYLILRCSMILGKKIKKGPIYDIINNKPLFINLDSKLQLVTSQAIADIIEKVLEKSIVGETINVGGRGSFSFKKIKKYIDREIEISRDSKTQIYEMNIEKLKGFYKKLKTSEEYLKDFF